MNSPKETFFLQKGHPILNERIPFPPFLLNLTWEQKNFVVPFSPEQEGKILHVHLYEERNDDLNNSFSYSLSDSLVLNDSNTILVQIQNGRAEVDLGKPKKIEKKCTSKNFVLVFFVDENPLKISQPFLSRSKWVSKSGDDNTDSLITRLQAMREDIHNCHIIRLIENVKSDWKKKKDQIPKDDKKNKKIWEQNIAICTWLQTKLVNECEEIPLQQIYNRAQDKYLKKGKVERKSLDKIKEIVESIQKIDTNIQVDPFIPVTTDGITYYQDSSKAKNSQRKRVLNSPSPPIKRQKIQIPSLSPPRVETESQPEYSSSLDNPYSTFKLDDLFNLESDILKIDNEVLESILPFNSDGMFNSYLWDQY